MVVFNKNYNQYILIHSIIRKPEIASGSFQCVYCGICRYVDYSRFRGGGSYTGVHEKTLRLQQNFQQYPNNGPLP